MTENHRISFTAEIDELLAACEIAKTGNFYPSDSTPVNLQIKRVLQQIPGALNAVQDLGMKHKLIRLTNELEPFPQALKGPDGKIVSKSVYIGSYARIWGLCQEVLDALTPTRIGF